MMQDTPVGAGKCKRGKGSSPCDGDDDEDHKGMIIQC